jgi:beta-glucosidase
MKLSIAIAVLLAGLTAATPKGNPRDTKNAIYKNPKASVDDRVADLLWRMTTQEKVAQIVQGDISNWMNFTDNTFNVSGLVWNMENRAGQFYVGPFPVDPQWLAAGIKRGQDYLLHNTTLGIPALVQSEGIHGVLICESFEN